MRREDAIGVIARARKPKESVAADRGGRDKRRRRQKEDHETRYESSSGLSLGSVHQAPFDGHVRASWARMNALSLEDPSGRAPILVVRDLACRRGDRLIFRALSFALRPGDAMLLTGPNGSGKSSLLRLLAGLSVPLTGVLEWDGTAIAQDAAGHRARLHFVGHHDAVKPVLTAVEMLSFWGALRESGPPRLQQAKTREALERLGLGHLALSPCRLLSAGQKRRLSLARLFAGRAQLWLLDEPTNGLDAVGVRLLEDGISAHREAGGIIIAATHTPILAERPTLLCPADYAPRRQETALEWSQA
jgi:heme exporter protein A